MYGVMSLLPPQAFYVGSVIRVLTIKENLLFFRRGCLCDRDRCTEGGVHKHGVTNENGNKAECSRLHREVF